VESPKLVLHVTAPTSKECRSAPHSPCNLGSELINVTGAIGQPYSVYLLMVDGNQAVGALGASFGVSHGPHIRLDWTLCADGIESRDDTWPASGTGNVITWNTCQETPTPGDLDNGVTAVIGCFYSWAYADDSIQLIPNPSSGEYKVSTCVGRAWNLDPTKAGRAGFGSQAGFDPCKGLLSPYSRFQDLTEDDLNSVVIKLSSVVLGHVSLVFSPKEADMTKFGPFHREGYGYGGDSDPYRFTISPAEVKEIIRRVGMLPQVTSGGVVRGFISFSLLSTAGTETSCFEAMLAGTTDPRGVIDAMNLAFVNNPPAKDALMQFACGRFLTNASDLPMNVSGSVAITYSEIEFDPVSKLYVTSMSAKNVGSSPIPGPITVVIHTNGAVLQDPDGRTCAIAASTFLSWPYITIDSGMAPGTGVEKRLRFDHVVTTLEMIKETEVFAGEGLR